ncbi:hypothetical protein PAXINDRAFT_99700 [Paxillus involutus ATCC 200175]|uniref:SEC63 domain-containing protein n=1 Tax=Paxillus involutus ATCC 200175 TaxID=664439 RepID=A0A0C9U737_PAXIN|nr:hypothetical protein PAXINDRAFT_99700 [Paxillus involutus ATCC 200175]
MAHQFGTDEPLLLCFPKRTKLKGLLEVVSSSTEFDAVPLRRHEDIVLRRIYDRVPVKLERVDFEAHHFKTFFLQAHFSRIQLPADLAADQVLVLEKVLSLLSACVVVMSSNAWLSALGAMDLSQICPEVIKRCKDAGIESVYDIMEMGDDKQTVLIDVSIESTPKSWSAPTYESPITHNLSAWLPFGNTLVILLSRAILSSTLENSTTQRAVMTRTLYYSYAVSDEWLLQEAARMGIRDPREEIVIFNTCMIIMIRAGLFMGRSAIKRVTAPPTGEQEYWCFTMASNDRSDNLPNPRGKGIRPVREESYQRLKQLLGLDHEPCWYPYVEA